jgi:hypothetical protein
MRKAYWLTGAPRSVSAGPADTERGDDLVEGCFPAGLQPGQQLVRTPTTAGGGAEPEARRASRREAGDHGLRPDQEHDEGASRSILLILLRALGAMHT